MREVTNHLYSRICDLAGVQGGFVSRAQLVGVGVNAPTIDSWLETHRLRSAWHGVYAVGHLPTEPRARAFGAMLAAGDGAALARFSAAAFYGAVKRWAEPCELLSPRRGRVHGLHIRMSSTLALRDVWRYGGLRVTSPARTSLDLAAGISTRRLKAVVDHLRLRHGLNLDQLRDILVRNPRHLGAHALRELIGQAPTRATRSGLERRWPQFACAHGLPPYEVNVVIAGHEVDVLVDGLVIVELDTFETHLLNFESDRQRDAEILASTGIPTIRVTDRQLRDAPGRVARQIADVAGARRADQP